MPARAASPTTSENDFDISKALFQEDKGSERSDVELDMDGLSKPPNAHLDMMADDDDEADGDAAFISAQQSSVNRKASALKGRTVKKGGGFQAMGLNANLLKAITRKGFSVPTPIQRKTIPLVLDDLDVVGMARTGSGKTAAFVIPMIEKLKSHSAKVGARALILSPSRELALQTMKVVKELGKGTDLKSVLLVGGDSLEEQFGYMTSNPDIIIATPGRFLHLKVEMNLDLSSIRYVVFDEADRLFEMGFAAQLTEILHGLPSSRQTLLFSATLPKSLVEFARAGLQEPSLVRLDAESKISPDLQNAFFSVKSSDKEGALLYLLHDVIKVPVGETKVGQILKDQAKENTKNPKKRKRAASAVQKNDSPTEHSTLVFVSTKHHVDYVTILLRESGFAVSYAYGSLDQTARKIQVNNFRSGISQILVVTDVAARGIDIPILSNVVNYDFPSQPKIFVHRVGRTARAGRKGWSFSLVRDSDAPYLLDLQLFLGRPLVVGRHSSKEPRYSDDVVVGSLVRDAVSRYTEWVSKLLEEDADIGVQRGVAQKGEKLYMRSRNAASAESAKRAKDLVESKGWMTVHPLFNDESSQLEVERENMLARLSGYRPPETIFEVHGKSGGKKSTDDTTELMRNIRSTFESKRLRKLDLQSARPEGKEMDVDDKDLNGQGEPAADNMSEASDSDLEVTFSYPHQSKSKSKQSEASKSIDPIQSKSSFQNPEYFMSYTPKNNSLAEDRAYGVHSGSAGNFAEASRHATMDLTGDESASRTFGEARSKRWDKRHKKYVSTRNDEDGSKGGRLVRGESGVKIAASFRSGRFDTWKKNKRIGRMPRVGESEAPGMAASTGGVMGKRFRHSKEQAPKAPDKLRGDYEKKKKKVEAAKQREADGGLDLRGSSASNGKGKGAKGVVRSLDDIRKNRKLKEKRREKTARPSRKGK